MGGSTPDYLALKGAARRTLEQIAPVLPITPNEINAGELAERMHQAFADG